MPSAQLTNRFIRVMADLGGKYRFSSGFVIREGVALTSAHGLAGAHRIVISDLHGMRYEVSGTEEPTLLGDAAGPALDKAPDLALLSASGLGQGLPPFPIARLNRSFPNLVTLPEVQVFGFPKFMETITGQRTRRESFQDTGRLLLQSRMEIGLLDLDLPTRPRELDPRDDVASQWSGISGAPVFVGKYLVGLVTEHAPRMGPARLAVTPLTLLDPDHDWPAWGPGVTNPRTWWERLGVGDPARLPSVPDDALSNPWIDDLRSLAEEFESAEERLPRSLRKPQRFAVQAHQALCEVFRELTEADFADAERALTRIVSEPGSATSVYGLTTSEALTSRQLAESLGQLLLVHRVAAEVPGLLSRLSYRLAVSMIDVEDLDAELARWIEMSADKAKARDVVRRLDISTDKDAYGDLVACLANAEWHQADPSVAARRLLDLVFSDKLGGPDTAEELERCFSMPTPMQTAATMLTLADTEPDRVVRDEHGFLVNEQPTMHHLRNGYFAPAEDLDRVEDAYWAWHRGDAADAGHRAVTTAVPMFWITGPSGAGKSILLLQLLARLNATAGVSVLLPDNAGELLVEATRQALSLGEDRHVIIGVDDPAVLAYESSAEWASAFSVLGKRRHGGDPPALPVFVCCAPTEHYERFKQSHAGEVRMTQFAIDPYRREFTDRLRLWYEERTGHRAETATSKGVPLPAQLFFEWWTGMGIGAFARRFRSRITERRLTELTEFFDRLLAVNRIYVGYPPEAVDALSPSTRDALADFQRDMHVNRNAVVARSGYWLSHPHLANLIYDEWFPEPGSHEQRGAHLTTALLEAVRLGQDGWASLPLIEQLLRVIDPGNFATVSARTHADQASTALRVGAAEVEKTANALAPTVLASWVKAERAVSGGLGGWCPLAEAIARLREAYEAEPPLRGLIKALAILGRAEADDAVWEFLREHPDWSAWAPTAALLLNGPQARAHVGILAAGIRARSGNAEGLDLLCSALQSWPGDRVLTPLAHELVERSSQPSSPLASLVAVLYAQGGQSEQIAYSWLQAAVREGNGLVFQDILRRGNVPLVAFAALRKWLVKYPLEDAADAGFALVSNWQWLRQAPVNEALGAHLSHRDAGIAAPLFDRLRELLKEDHPSWSFLFCRLTPAQAVRPEMRAVGLSWLNRNSESGAWGRVYTHLCQSVPEPDPELAQVGIGRLPVVWDSPDCVHLLGLIALVMPEADHPAVGETILRWLQEHPDPQGWGFLADHVPFLHMMAEAGLEQAVASVLQWWKEHQDTPASSYVLRALLHAPPTSAREEIIDQTESWLQIPRIGWGHVFLSLPPDIADSRAVTIAIPWLSEEIGDERWAAVLSEIATRLTPGQLADLTYKWFSLPTNPRQDSEAGFLWKIAMEDGPCRKMLADVAFRKVVNTWLTVNGQLKSWWHIWRETYKADPADMGTVLAALTAELRNERGFGVANMIARTVTARTDLTEPTWEFMSTSPRGNTWQLIWLRLSLMAPTEACWETGISHLAQLAPEHFSPWWRRLWNAFPDEPRRGILRAVGRAWLASNPDPNGKIKAKLDEDAATRITPATVFGARRPKSPRVTIGTVPIAASTGDAGPAVSSSKPPNTALACPNCGNQFDLPDGPGPTQRRYACLRCAAALSINTGSWEVTVMRMLERRPATAKRYMERKAGPPRPVVQCGSCGRHRQALIWTADTFAALDVECGYLYEGRSDLRPRLPALYALPRDDHDSASNDPFYGRNYPRNHRSAA